MRMPSIGLAILWVTTLAGCAPSNPLPPEYTETQTVPTVMVTLAQSPTPTLSMPPSNCSHMPLGGFNDVWRNEQVWPYLGCAVAPAESISGTEAYICCYHSGIHSIWLSQKHLFVTLQDSGRQWTFVPDESGWPSNEPLMEEPVPRPQPCFEATGRHGWLAHSPSWMGQCRGLSRTSEATFSGAMQQFEGGWLLWNGNVCFVLFDTGMWTMF
jgi:hypothetical protein